MGKFAEQQKAKDEARENDKLTRESLGKYFYDLAKVTFTAMVVGGAVTWISDTAKEYSWKLLCVGIATTFILTYIGYKIIKR